MDFGGRSGKRWKKWNLVEKVEKGGNMLYYLDDGGIIMLLNPISKDNFKEIVTNCYYVDKTNLINEILDKGDQGIYLMLRPRRFGKSVIVSMLEYFFDIQKKDDDIFKGLEIAKSKYYYERNTYPTIRLSFKDLEKVDYHSLIITFKEIISSLYIRHKYLLDSDVLEPIEKTYVSNMINKCGDDELSSSIRKLSEFLYRYHQKKVVILIDEYDTPIISSTEKDFYDKALLLFKNIYSEGLKDNPNIKFAFLTGVLKVSKDYLFSGLNNLLVDDGYTTYFNEYFGFDYQESRAILDYFNLGKYYDEVVDWYGGYTYHRKDLVNPWSILSFIATGGEFRPYWSKTSSNTALSYLFSNVTSNLSDSLSRLLNREKLFVKLYINYSPFDEEEDINVALNLLISSGYLTATEGEDVFEGLAHIPNKEIGYVFRNEIISNYQLMSKDNNNIVDKLRVALLTGKQEEIALLIEKFITFSLSYFEFNDEKSYQIIVSTLSAILFGNHLVRMEDTLGEGRCDISITPIKENSFGSIIEIKYVSSKISEARLQKTAEVAVKQIKNKEYYQSLVRTSAYPIIIYGFAFMKKKVKIASERIR